MAKAMADLMIATVFALKGKTDILPTAAQSLRLAFSCYCPHLGEFHDPRRPLKRLKMHLKWLRMQRGMLGGLQLHLRPRCGG